MFRTTQSLFALVRPLAARSIQLHNAKSGSIGLLPVELLLDVLELLDRNELALCMQVCRRWYDIASPYFFAVVPVRYFHCKHFAKHIRKHPKLAEYINDVYFFDQCWGDSGNQRHMEIDSCPLDIHFIASTLPLLINLRQLFIVGYEDKTDLPLPLRHLARRQSAPLALQRLTLESCQKVAFILHGLLPLFSVDTLITDAFAFSLCGQKPKADIYTLFPAASVVVRNLAVRGTVKDYYEFFERTLAPGCLRGLGTGSWWRGNLHLLDRFLRSSAAQNLESISVGGIDALHEPPRSASDETPSNRTLSVCGILGAVLSRCTRLQYVQVGIIHRGPPEEDPFCRSDALEPLLTSLPTTLRALSFHVWIPVYPQRSFELAGPMRHVDRLLDPIGEGRRLRHLRTVEVHVRYWYREGTVHDPGETFERVRFEDGVTLLPRLQAAGLLRRFRVDDTELGPDSSADVYWPPDTTCSWLTTGGHRGRLSSALSSPYDTMD